MKHTERYPLPKNTEKHPLKSHLPTRIPNCFSTAFLRYGKNQVSFMGVNYKSNLHMKNTPILSTCLHFPNTS